MPPMPRTALATALLLVGAFALPGDTGRALADGGALAPELPWSERAITTHLVHERIAGDRRAPGGAPADGLTSGASAVGRVELDRAALAPLLAAGERLFEARFTAEDGVGRPLATQAILPTKRRRPARTTFSRTAGLDANACSGCHDSPRVGGAGDFAANVFVAEGFSQADFDTTDPQFSNERNTNHLFGAGLIELLAREMSATLHAQRDAALARARASGDTVTAALAAKGVPFGEIDAYPDGRVDPRGLDGVDSDLVIRPFGHKGVMTSLRQFTVNALNHHHGMQAEERFGARWTGEPDHDGDAHEREIGDGDVSALVAWQATLPPPVVGVPTGTDEPVVGVPTGTDKPVVGVPTGTDEPVVGVPTGTTDEPVVGLPAGTDSDAVAWRAAAARGRERLDTLGCSVCHRPALPLESTVFEDPGPLDAAGTLRRGEATGLHYDLALDPRIAALPRDADGRVLVPLFGDLKRHRIADSQVATLGNELLSQRFVERDVFMTTELWGVGSTAPYGHRGDLTTLAGVIEAHGGAARASRDAWLALDAPARGDVVAFLKTLLIAP